MKTKLLVFLTALSLLAAGACTRSGDEGKNNGSSSSDGEVVTQLKGSSGEKSSSDERNDDNKNQSDRTSDDTEDDNNKEKSEDTTSKNQNRSETQKNSNKSQQSKTGDTEDSDDSLDNRFRKKKAEEQKPAEKKKTESDPFTREDYVNLLTRMESKPVHTFKLHTKGVTDLSFTPNGERMVSGGNDERVILWDLKKFEYNNTFFCGSPVQSVATSVDQKHYAGGTERGIIQIWNNYYELVDSKSRGETPVTALAYGPRGNFLAAGTAKGKIHVWNLNDNKLYATFKNHVKAITDLDFNTDGDHLLSSSKDGTVKEWNLHNKIMLRGLNVDGWNSINSVQYSPDEKYLVCGSVTGNIYVFNMKKLMKGEKDHYLLTGHKKAITSLVFHPKWNFMASASREKLMVIWSLDDEKPVVILKSDATISTAAVGPSGNLFAAGCTDGSIPIWSTGRKKPDITNKNSSEPYHSMDVFKNFQQYNKKFQKLRMKLNKKFQDQDGEGESRKDSGQSSENKDRSTEKESENEENNNSSGNSSQSSTSDSKKNAALKRIKTHPPLRPTGNQYKFQKKEDHSSENASSNKKTTGSEEHDTDEDSGKPESYKLVRVDPSGHGDYKSLQKAVREVGSHTKIRIEPGIYKKPIEISGSDLILFSAPGNVVISNPSGTGVSIVGGKDITIMGLTVRDCKGHGIVARKGTELKLENIVIEGNGETGILISGSSTRANLKLVDIKNNKRNGLLIQKNGNASVTDCTLSGHNSRYAPAVEINGAGSDVSLLNCTIRDNKTDALLAREGSAPTVKNCSLYGNKLSGIYLHNCQKKARIINNKLYKNGGSSIIVEKSTPPVIRGNEIYSHLRRVPAVFLNRSGATLINNTFRKNRDVSLYAQDPSSLRIEGNTFSGYSDTSSIPSIHLAGTLSRIVLKNNTFGRGHKKALKGIQDFKRHKVRGNKFKSRKY